MDTSAPTDLIGSVRTWISGQGLEPSAVLVALVGAFCTWFFGLGLRLNPMADTNSPEMYDIAMSSFRVFSALLILAPIVALWRPWTALALAVPMALWVPFTGANLPMSLYAGLLAAAVAAVFRSTWAAIALLIAAVATAACYCLNLITLAVPFGPTVYEEHSNRGDKAILLGAYALISTLLVGLGMLLRARSRTAAERRALKLEALAVARQSAQVDERARLARDLHDVVAHHVSLIAVRAETAPFQHPQMDAASVRVLQEVAVDARTALEELRGVLGVLRRSDGERAPQPGIGDLDALIDRARASGQQIDLTSDHGDVGAAQGYAAYRLVQEALTNARKHAPGAPVRVAIHGGDDLPLEVAVLNAYDAARATPTDGRGLAGMRERAEALDGDLTAAPLGGDFVVKATLPAAKAGD